MKAFVGIASSGRDQILVHTLRNIHKQTLRPNAVFVCKPSAEDLEIAAGAGLEAITLSANKGSCPQRNAILDAVKGEHGVLLIIDDDFILHPRYLETLACFIELTPNVALVNGRLLEDGISGPGVSVVEAEKLIERTQAVPLKSCAVRDIPTAYGCNMGLNLEIVRDLRFDEGLPLYGWQEDVDFSTRLKKSGRIVRLESPAGVHLGAKVGRTSGVRFGYSQVLNPLYLLRKGTMTPTKASWLIGKNIGMNLARSVWSEPYLDRRGRLKGNALAVADLIRGRGRPDRIFEL